MTRSSTRRRGSAVVLPREAFTIAEAERLGLSRSAVYRLAAQGQLERVAPGTYQRADDALRTDLDLREAAIRAPRATICLTSALVIHGLTDEIPAATDLAVPRGTRRPATSSAIRWHQWDGATFDIGRGERTIDGSDTVIGIYSAERSIVDAFRTRSVTGYETATEALRRWLPRRGSHPADLLDVARLLPRARGPVLEALQYLA